MFLYMLAFMLTSVIEQAFFLDKACIVNHNYTREICDGISTNDELKREVQVKHPLQKLTKSLKQ